MKENWFSSIIGDREFDPDAAKVIGIISIIIAAVGFFMGKANFEAFLIAGASMVTAKCIKENT